MGRNTVAAVAASVLVLGGFAAEAAATDIHVPGDFRRLQDAVDAAKPGDRVFVDRGRHRAPINVRTPDIEIIGSARARIVGKDMGNFHGSLFVHADGVAVRGLVFVKSGVRSEADRTTVDGCVFRRYADANVSRAVISVFGSSAEVTGNEIQADCRAPMGIEVLGDRATVSGNRVAGRLDTFAVRVVGEQPLAEGNGVDAPLALRGLIVAGDAAVVRENALEACDLIVIGDGSAVSANTVVGADIGQASISVEGNGNLLVGTGIEGGLDTGVLVRGNDNVLEGNAVEGNGSYVDGLPWGHGFVVRGSGNLLTDNAADGCVAEAFRVVGNGEVQLVMHPDGRWEWMPVALGDGNVLDGCTGTGAGTCGLGNWTVGTEVTGSTFEGNGVDIVSGFDFPLFSGNSWNTGGPGYEGSGNGDETSDTFGPFSTWGGD